MQAEHEIQIRWQHNHPTYPTHLQIDRKPIISLHADGSRTGDANLLREKMSTMKNAAGIDAVLFWLVLRELDRDGRGL